MKHFQYSVMGHGILLRSLGWATKISGNVMFSSGPPSSYFMSGPLQRLNFIVQPILLYLP